MTWADAVELAKKGTRKGRLAVVVLGARRREGKGVETAVATRRGLAAAAPENSGVNIPLASHAPPPNAGKGGKKGKKGGKAGKPQPVEQDAQRPNEARSKLEKEVLELRAQNAGMCRRMEELGTRWKPCVRSSRHRHPPEDDVTVAEAAVAGGAGQGQEAAEVADQVDVAVAGAPEAATVEDDEDPEADGLREHGAGAEVKTEPPWRGGCCGREGAPPEAGGMPATTRREGSSLGGDR
ncbi:hypothetical protein DIPPA_30934 [Diplonema papillatum]|nr:hypothetical protein DIPPA_30934 [Diplonema papillatum]